MVGFHRCPSLLRVSAGHITQKWFLDVLFAPNKSWTFYEPLADRGCRPPQPPPPHTHTRACVLRDEETEWLHCKHLFPLIRFNLRYVTKLGTIAAASHRVKRAGRSRRHHGGLVAEKLRKACVLFEALALCGLPLRSHLPN